MPVIVAPMAGGPSTPELAAAGTNAGGLGFVAAGYLTAEVFAERIAAARRLTSGPLGVNLFVPQPSAAHTRGDRALRGDAGREAQRYGAALGEPRYDDDAWAAKLDVVLDLRPEVVSFTFGLPTAAECARIRTPASPPSVPSRHWRRPRWRSAAASMPWWRRALRRAGTAARSIPPRSPRPNRWASCSLRRRSSSVPVVAAGGLVTADDVNRVLRAGAVAAQLGTAFLLADEAGSSPVHRAALQDPQFTETVVTKAFSGRYARGLRNRFIDEHEAQAPFGYPEIHYLTSPLRAASVRAGDPHAVNVWAGTGFRMTKAAPVAEIIRDLT